MPHALTLSLFSLFHSYFYLSLSINLSLSLVYIHRVYLSHSHSNLTHSYMITTIRRCRWRRLRSHFGGAVLLLRAHTYIYYCSIGYVQENGSHHHSHCVIGILQIFSFNNQLHKLRSATGFSFKTNNYTLAHTHTHNEIEINKILLRRRFWSMHRILSTSVWHPFSISIPLTGSFDLYLWMCVCVFYAVRFTGRLFSLKSTSNVHIKP